MARKLIARKLSERGAKIDARAHSAAETLMPVGRQYGDKKLTVAEHRVTPTKWPGQSRHVQTTFKDAETGAYGGSVSTYQKPGKRYNVKGLHLSAPQRQSSAGRDLSTAVAGRARTAKNIHTVEFVANTGNREKGPVAASVLRNSDTPKYKFGTGQVRHETSKKNLDRLGVDRDTQKQVRVAARKTRLRMHQPSDFASRQAPPKNVSPEAANVLRDLSWQGTVRGQNRDLERNAAVIAGVGGAGYAAKRAVAKRKLKKVAVESKKNNGLALKTGLSVAGIGVGAGAVAGKRKANEESAR